jgi:hypothetical protein
VLMSSDLIVAYQVRSCFRGQITLTGVDDG